MQVNGLYMPSLPVVHRKESADRSDAEIGSKELDLRDAAECMNSTFAFPKQIASILLT